MIKERKVECKEVEQLKKNNILEMSWNYLDKNDILYLYEENNHVCAVIRMSCDPYDEIWIDEFEVVKKYRKQGIGKWIISNILKDCNQKVRLMAKNNSVAEFWCKCGFRYEYYSDEEIPMVYSK